MNKTRRRNTSGGPDPEPPATPEAPADPLAAADLEASIAEHAVRLAHLYIERIRISEPASDHASAIQDRSRAGTLCGWAKQAMEATNVAGHGVLQPRLEHLRFELDSVRLSKAASNRG